MDTPTPSRPATLDLGLLFLRLASALMLFMVHGMPKVLDYAYTMVHKAPERTQNKHEVLAAVPATHL